MPNYLPSFAPLPLHPSLSLITIPCYLKRIAPQIQRPALEPWSPDHHKKNMLYSALNSLAYRTICSNVDKIKKKSVTLGISLLHQENQLKGKTFVFGIKSRCNQGLAGSWACMFPVNSATLCLILATLLSIAMTLSASFSTSSFARQTYSPRHSPHHHPHYQHSSFQRWPDPHSACRLALLHSS